ncbi:hypothetical protein [Micromonospora chersina]|uniref:DUF1109 domain-containing protein n=1 Tax=Micromonospora chersina TaxID=47854 RepID=A0A1C6UBE2_9ACTN|nr:hypothetical protein [Micromonospora chersina]SCL51298.1 hypothetical protein GA0070603_1170 [Micromonospora chersina]
MVVSTWWALHAVVSLAAACLLWAFSVPGFSLLLVLCALPLLCLAGAAWAVWVVTFGVRRQWSWSFLPAPMIVVLALALLGTGAPLQARWAMSRSAFDRVVATVPTTGAVDGDWSSVPVPSRIGSYLIMSAYRVPGGVVFYEVNGSMTDDAGFAYLPDGPTPDLETPDFESPVFKHLGGAWYSWTASW